MPSQRLDGHATRTGRSDRSTELTRRSMHLAQRHPPAPLQATSSKVTLDLQINPFGAPSDAVPQPIATSYKQPRVNKRPIAKLSDLEVITELGDGAWGAAYLARVKRRSGKATGETGDLFALKRVEKRAYRDYERNDPRKDRREAAQSKHFERRALATLPWNPFVAGLIDAYTDPRNTYLLLELGHRNSIRECMTEIVKGPLPLPMAQFYFSNLTLAIEFIHSHGIVHRDIKNENILIGADGYAMLTDFGHAQVVHEGKKWDPSGTFLFVSPEIAESAMNTPEARYASDWWSAACALFEMVTDRVPFKPSNMDYEELAEKQAKKLICWPEDYEESPIWDLLGRMFEPQLSSRFGARTQSQGDYKMNVELRGHHWMSELRWDRIETRIEIAPVWSTPLPDLSRAWHRRKLPQQRKAPGLALKRCPLQFNDAGNLETNERPRKRRRMAHEPIDVLQNLTHEA